MYKCDNSKPYCKEKDLRVRRNNGQNQVKYNTIHMLISFITTYLKKKVSLMWQRKKIDICFIQTCVRYVTSIINLTKLKTVK